jgi:protein-L-isoaspartate O-methyltransferase
VYELAEVADRARRNIEEAGLTDRCAVRCGDAFAEVPPGGDAYILSRVLHDWGDDQACQILANCRMVLPPGGRVLLIERTMPDSLREIAAVRRPSLSDILMTDLNMMVMAGGCERTIAEYEHLLRKAGLELVKVARTQTAMNVIEARAS